MSSGDRRPYLSATSLTQDLLDASHDNLECRLEMVCEIETPSGTIYASDRNKYVGGTFYEALVQFPVIGRTVGEWLAGELQFSTLSLTLSNVDGRFNDLLAGGANFGGWIGKSVVVKLGLAEAAATYRTVFSGTITDIGGFRRNIKSIQVISRDRYDALRVNFPADVFTESAYPKIETRYIGKVMPVVYGDWTVETDPYPAAVPAYATNGNDPEVSFADRLCTISQASPGVVSLVSHDFDEGDPLVFTTGGTLPTPLVAATVYYAKNVGADAFSVSATPFGAAINTTSAGSGEHRVKADPAGSRKNLALRISSNDLSSFSSAEVYVKRGENFYLAPSAEVVNVGAGNKTFELQQGASFIDGNPFEWTSSDEIYVKVIGPTLSGYQDNIVEQARHILTTYGGLVSGDFDASWNTYRDKATPAQSNVAGFKSRIWIAEPTPVITYALSLLEQVRLEAFIDVNLKLKINSLHFEDWTASPTYMVRNWDVEANSLRTTTDERNVFNRAQGFYNFLPIINENGLTTRIHKNTASITQIGKAISKKVVFPNLYVEADVAYQVVEILRLSSSGLEIIDANLTWRSMLQDIGGFVSLDVKIGSTQFDTVPCMIRDIGYDPAGLKIPVKVWSMLMVPFPGYTPGYAGTVGGYAATIDVE
jgi:hypothetical protein